MQIELPSAIDEATAAAIIAAVELAFSARPVAALPHGRPGAWSTAGRLAAQGLPGARSEVGWSSADRVGRAARWSGGTPSSFHDW